MKSKICKLLSGARQGLFALALTMFSGAVYSQTSYTFSYTGGIQTLSLQAGTYSIQCWGAIGGWHANDPNLQRGKGGYSCGTITLTASTNLYIAVGGAGGTQINGTVPGGWNGGGAAKYYTYSYNGGGGATHVATATGTLGALASNTSAVLIVAGGGGGGASSQTPGNGGGLNGGNSTRSGCTGGTQTTPGASSISGGNASFGQGWVGTPTGGSYGAGGGGWYGGGCESGGSSYIGGVTSGTTIMFGQPGFVTNPDVTGNGRVIITELCNITLVNNATNSFNSSICSGQSLTLTTNAISNYSWSTGATTSSLVVSPTSNTVYALTAMSPSNCMTSATHSVIVSSGIPVLSVNTSTNSVCLGDSVTLTASGALTHTWSHGVSNGQIFAPSSTTTYTVTGQNGCGINTATTAVTVSPLQIGAVSSSSIVCAGNTATLTAAGANSFTWTAGSQTTTGTSMVVAPFMQTVYTVTGSIGGCIGTTSISISTKANPTVNIAGTGSVVCAGQSVTMTVNGADTYTWNPATLSGTYVVATPTSPTLYQVSGTNSLGCTTGTSYVVVTKPSPTINVSANPFMICSGGQATLSASGADAYAWTGGASTNTTIVNPPTTTVYTVTGTFTNTGCDASNTVAVTVFEPVLAISPSTSVCPGSAVSLTAGPGSGYLWSTGSVFQGITVYPTQTSVYTVSATVTSSANLNCPASNSVEVTVYAQPTVTASATRTSICRGELSSLTAGGAGTYLWSVNNNTTAAFTFSTNIITTHSISVIGTDVNGCKDTAAVSIKVNSCNGLAEYMSGSLRLYPNPNNGTFVIESDEDLYLEISNELGQVVRTVRLNAVNGHHLNISEISNGIYFLKGSGSEGPLRQKIIVNK